jgi:glycerol transport system ATP-binding protein
VRLVLENISKKHGAQDHLYPLSLALVPGTINVLLGTTQAGKTTLMRVMAGLDRPTRGRVLVDDTDVTGVPVRQRNLAMVYQQFINYPSFSVFENNACTSPRIWSAYRPSYPAASNNAARWPVP